MERKVDVYSNQNQGFAMIISLLLLVVLMVLIAGHFAITSIEISTANASQNSTTAFYAAEAGLNIRAKEVRETFEGFNRPKGTSPNDYKDCLSGSTGSEDFACKNYNFSGHKVWTYTVDETPLNPILKLIPPGEKFAGLVAQEYKYTTYSVSLDKQDFPEAILGLTFKNRLIPIFQFVVFYNKDLEIHNGPLMTINGPVHVNGDLYFDPSSEVEVLGQITVSKRSPDDIATYSDEGGKLYRGHKPENRCRYGDVEIAKEDNTLEDLDCLSSNRVLLDQSDVSAWGDRIRLAQSYLEVPEPDTFAVGGSYWQKADLRVVLRLDNTGALDQIRVLRDDESLHSSGNASLNSCQKKAASSPYRDGSLSPVPTILQDNKAVSASQQSMYNIREHDWMTMLEVDVVGLLTCLEAHPGILGAGSAGPAVGIDDTTDGGLVIYFTVDGPDSDSLNTYGIRLYNGARLATDSDKFAQGLTVVSDQAVYTHGDYNRDVGRMGSQTGDQWIPASILSDSYNILSNAWQDGNDTTCVSSGPDASDTQINVAFLSGTDSSGDAEGVNGQDNGNNTQSGGWHNYLRKHEDWGSSTLQYLGSFASLGRPDHVQGKHLVDQCYSPPTRDWAFDTRFYNIDDLPPMTPNAVYLSQELFERSFDEAGF